MWVSVFICGPAYPCLTSQLVFFQPLISMAGPRATLVWDLGQIRHHHHHMTDSLITWEPQVPTGGGCVVTEPAWSSVNTWDTFGWCLLVSVGVLFNYLHHLSNYGVNLTGGLLCSIKHFVVVKLQFIKLWQILLESSSIINTHLTQLFILQNKQAWIIF